MIPCPACRTENPDSGRFCSACGSALGSALQDSASPTIQTPRSGSPFRSLTSDSLDEGRFVAGTLLAERYRIIGRLGKGGMGEVYRANDLKLGQAVALKFLPEDIAGDSERLAHLHTEVRLSRQVSHPNICRVYDIGEVGHLHFITMEFVDGEDLASLLRRIGRLPPDKGLQIARQLCAMPPP